MNEFTAVMFTDLDINPNKQGNILAAGMCPGNCFTEVLLANYSVEMQKGNCFPESLEAGEAIGETIIALN